MGYEISGALGIKMAKPNQDVVVFVGDGSYLLPVSYTHLTLPTKA